VAGRSGRSSDQWRVYLSAGARIGSLGEVAIRDNKRKIKAFDGICRLKSTRLCISRPQQATSDPAVTARTESILAVIKRFRLFRKTRTTNNKAHSPPYYSTICEQLQKVIVRMIHDEPVVETRTTFGSTLFRFLVSTP
jgi:hypothetical protein